MKREMTLKWLYRVTQKYFRIFFIFRKAEKFVIQYKRYIVAASVAAVAVIVSAIVAATAVASLGLVSPGTATDGVTPIFPLKNGDLLVIATK